jgi:hypothetical protein
MDPKTKRLAQCLCAGGVLVTFALLVIAAPGARTAPNVTVTTTAAANSDCVGCRTANRFGFANSGDPVIDAQRLADAQASMKAEIKRRNAIAFEAHFAERSKWKGTYCRPAIDAKEPDKSLHKSIGDLFIGADPQAPSDRQTHFAWCFDPAGDFQCVGYFGTVKSVKEVPQGWEVVLDVSPNLVSRKAPSVISHQICTETWHVSNDGRLTFVSALPLDPKTAGPGNMITD